MLLRGRRSVRRRCVEPLCRTVSDRTISDISLFRILIQSKTFSIVHILQRRMVQYSIHDAPNFFFWKDAMCSVSTFCRGTEENGNKSDGPLAETLAVALEYSVTPEISFLTQLMLSFVCRPAQHLSNTSFLIEISWQLSYFRSVDKVCSPSYSTPLYIRSLPF
jgi:hypothetical protein